MSRCPELFLGYITRCISKRFDEPSKQVSAAAYRKAVSAARDFTVQHKHVTRDVATGLTRSRKQAAGEVNP